MSKENLLKKNNATENAYLYIAKLAIVQTNYIHCIILLIVLVNKGNLQKRNNGTENAYQLAAKSASVILKRVLYIISG